jgi:hypothetical protein
MGEAAALLIQPRPLGRDQHVDMDEQMFAFMSAHWLARLQRREPVETSPQNALIGAGKKSAPMAVLEAKASSPPQPVDSVDNHSSLETAERETRSPFIKLKQWTEDNHDPALLTVAHRPL